ncbi:unnamed protein product, partial [Allacma fusca]
EVVIIEGADLNIREYGVRVAGLVKISEQDI